MDAPPGTSPYAASNVPPGLLLRSFRGGKRQRQETRDEISSHAEQQDIALAEQENTALVGLTEFDSHLCKLLAQQWAWGILSAVAVQKYASAALEDAKVLLNRLHVNFSSSSNGPVSVSLSQFAALGCGGSCPGNIAKELRLLLGEPEMPPIHQEKIMTRFMKPGIWKPHKALVGHSFLLPHVVFSYLYHHNRAKFNQVFLGNRTSDQMAKFWTTVIERRDPRIIRHPMVERDNWMCLAVPLALHGDGVPVIGVGKAASRSLDTYSMHGIWATGSTIQMKLLLYSVFEKCKVSGVDENTDTMKAAWKLLAWSFAALFSGYHPKTDSSNEPWPIGSAERFLADANTPLADGYFAPIWLLKGDLDHYAKNLKLADYRRDQCCNYCPANKGDDIGMQMSNFRRNAAWKKLLYNADQWKASLAQVHVLFALMSFLTGHNVECGELHIMHLGTSSYLLGSAFWLLCYHLLPGTPAAKLEHLWAIIVNHYSKHKTRAQLSNLSLSMFANLKKPLEEFAKLKAKGAETKHLMGAALEAWTEMTKGVASVFIDPVRTCMEQMVSIHDILDESRFLDFLDEADAAQLKTHVDVFLQAYSMAAHYAIRANLPVFTVAPKHHWLWHWADRAKLLNPRKGNEMLDEHFVGIMKDVGKTCTCSTPLHGVPAALMNKYRWGMHFQD